MSYCPSCGQSLEGGDYTAPWEDGDNSYGYVTCPHCGYDVILDSDDDDDY